MGRLHSGYSIWNTAASGTPPTPRTQATGVQLQQQGHNKGLCRIPTGKGLLRQVV